jgi:hypothetical protein
MLISNWLQLDHATIRNPKKSKMDGMGVFASRLETGEGHMVIYVCSHVSRRRCPFEGL